MQADWGWTLPSFGPNRAGVRFYQCGNVPFNMRFQDLPGQAGVYQTGPYEDDEYIIIDGLAGNCADGACTAFGTNVTGGGGSLHLKVRWNGTNWTLIAK